MEGQSEVIQKKKARTKTGCDVGCQTEQGSPSVFQQMSQLMSSSTSHVGTGAVDTTSSSASASGASTPANQAASSSPAPSGAPAADKKLTGPAGVKPNEIEAYFGEKKPPSLNSSTNTTQPQQAGQTTQKARAASTTGVVGEGKKQNSNANASSSNAAAGATNGKAVDGPSWNDENCKLRLVINRFSQLEETMCSPPKSIEGVSWKIMVMPKQHMVQKKQQKCMGFFLQCAPERAYSDQWSVHAIADMRMISYKPNVPHFARRTTHTYTSKENDWGYSCFMTWADIIDEAQGYIRDDTVVLEIAVKAEAPKNMMTHEDFLDKINKWIVLADMQMKKNNIDLALEANQSAMKFCKGKDEECYQRLETQRETFVNAKLFESIERIEKGPVVCTDTTHGKPTSLRQALTGAQKSLNGKMTAKGGKKARAVVTVQQMKKKKPYDQNNTNQQRTNTGGPTVKDLVEKRKSSKSDDALKKDLLRSKEELEADEQTESEDSPDEKALGSDEEEEIEFDDEEYNEGDYGSQADECSTLELFGSGHDETEDGDPTAWDDETTLRIQEGENDEDVMVCDRMVQTDFEEALRSVLEDTAGNSMFDQVFFKHMLATSVIRKFGGTEEGKDTVFQDVYFSQTGIAAAPGDSIEKIFGGESSEGEDAFSAAVLDVLPSNTPTAATASSEELCQLVNAEKLIKKWLDVEGALGGYVDPDGVLARLSDQDRRELLEELNFKLNPLIVSLDHEFRETVSCVNNCLESARTALTNSQRTVTECDRLKDIFEEKLSGGFVKDQKRQADNKKTTTSAAATSGSSAKSVSNGRPTVIAKRSMKQVVLDSDRNEERGRVSEFLKTSESAHALIQGDGETHRMRDALEGFKELHRKIQPMMSMINSNNEAFHRIFTQVTSENGVVAESVKKLVTQHAANQQDMMTKVTKAHEALELAAEDRKKNERRYDENDKRATEEFDKNLKAQKEIKDLKNSLKKAENKATKEETRATTLQVQLNELEEKAKVVRKELETLKKKSTEERAKTKKEKDRDLQTIRQQSIEIVEREKERDRARKELEDVTRQKEKFEKDKKAVGGQLTSMTERARAAEVCVMENKWTAALEEFKKRREAIQHGYTETETLEKRVRQASDRDVMRKSLGEWKAALDKCDAQIKSVKAEYDHAIEQIKNGVKTMSQTLDIKLPSADPLPNLVKPPPVQVVAPSPSVIPPPILPPPPPAGVIGQQRNPIGGARQVPVAAEAPAAAAAPSRARVPRGPSPPTAMKPGGSDAPSSLWSWNTIGNLGDLRPPSSNEFNSSMDSFQKDIWAANGNGNGSLGSDFLRGSQNSMASGLSSTGAPQQQQQQAPPQPSYLRSQSSQSQPQQQQQQQASMSMSQATYQQQHQQQNQMHHHHQTSRMQRGYGDLWNAAPGMQQQQQNSSQQDYPNRMMAPQHNGAGDLASSQGFSMGQQSPWHNPPTQQQQLRGGQAPQQQQQHNHNMFQPHSFFDNGM
ncbi:MATH domain-containing protein [Caenorhabditis elegans]|uniref:MATH domain-containing protein n=1 Tax=Caenorhabditis elegans TaxID=6239 RepID=K8ESL3_CAEEL|nr:MATH domain-containing protein [Caenorhabditis elegans]CCO25665.1 MATH domain-containing protein [Caenorhabditis elegans]|eukprot:NP_001263678.1 Prion-like-(Q/N-rich)-domain-bearing protein [Caenorhabditis elegans]